MDKPRYVVVVECGNNRVSHPASSMFKAIGTMANLLMFYLTTESDANTSITIDVYRMDNEGTTFIANCNA